MLIPLRSMCLPIRSPIRPLAVHFLISLNLMVFTYQILFIINGVDLIPRYSIIPSELFPYFLSHSRNFICSLFLHDIRWKMGFLHLITNMLYLAVFGPILEYHIGRIRFLLFYFTCGILATFIFSIFQHQSDVPVIGASAAIAGVMGAHLVVSPQARVHSLFLIYVVSLQTTVVLLLWIGTQILYAYISPPSTHTAWIAHVTGFFLGMILVRNCGRIEDVRPKNQWVASPLSDTAYRNPPIHLAIRSTKV